MPYFPTRRITIFAQDPSVRLRDPRTGTRRIARAQIEIPNEELEPGPRGYRVQIVDYDSATGTLYKPEPTLPNHSDRPPTDPFARKTDAELLNDRHFHAANTYAIIMRTLARFEFALGRRVEWSFRGHQL